LEGAVTGVLRPLSAENAFRSASEEELARLLDGLNEILG
jgi:hypothetical protein